jgi:Arm DNA-binding domain
MLLTNLVVRSSKPKDKQYKLTDGEGLHLLIKPNGGKYWQQRYRFLGKEKLQALGVYPQVSLAEAREKCREARKLLKRNIDPLEAKKEEKRQVARKNENTFNLIMYEWHEARIGGWKPKHAAKILRRLELNIIPSLGHRPIDEITAPELLSVIRTIESRGALDIAHRMLQTCG